MTTLAERLIQARKSIGMKQAELAARLEIHTNVYQNYERGKFTPKVETLLSLRSLGINIDWLVSGEGAMMIGQETGEGRAVAPALDPDLVLLPRFDVQASAGSGSMIHSEQVVDYFAIRRSWIRDRLRCAPENVVLIEAIGDSMEPTIGHGDLLLVDISAPKLRDSSIYVLSLDGELLVKRIERRLGGGIAVKGDNPRYDVEVFAADQVSLLTIVGQVVWHGGVL